MMEKGFLVGMILGTVPKVVAVIVRFENQNGWNVSNRMESEESKDEMILETR